MFFFLSSSQCKWRVSPFGVCTLGGMIVSYSWEKWQLKFWPAVR